MTTRKQTMIGELAGGPALCAGPARLADYDVIVVSTSGGKDSMATLMVVAEQAELEGVEDRVVAVHSDLGERVEWPGAGAAARAQAEFWGVRFLVTSRIGKVAQKDSSCYREGEAFGDLIDYAERRGNWPGFGPRWCTSEFKRGPIGCVFTALADAWRAATGERRACRILDCQGIRAEEGPARAKKTPFAVRESTSRKHIDTWYPIFHWLENDHLWPAILDSGAPYHYAYGLGARRLSCVFCIYAGIEDYLVAGRANPELLEEWAQAEERLQKSIQPAKSWEDAKARQVTLRDVQATIAAEPAVEVVEPAAPLALPCEDDEVEPEVEEPAFALPAADRLAALLGAGCAVNANGSVRVGDSALGRLASAVPSYAATPGVRVNRNSVTATAEAAALLLAAF